MKTTLSAIMGLCITLTGMGGTNTISFTNLTGTSYTNVVIVATNKDDIVFKRAGQFGWMAEKFTNLPTSLIDQLRPTAIVFTNEPSLHPVHMSRVLTNNPRYRTLVLMEANKLLGNERREFLEAAIVGGNETLHKMRRAALILSEQRDEISRSSDKLKAAESTLERWRNMEVRRTEEAHAAGQISSSVRRQRIDFINAREKAAFNSLNQLTSIGEEASTASEETVRRLIREMEADLIFLEHEIDNPAYLK